MPSTTHIRTCGRDFPGPGAYKIQPIIGCKHDPTFWINPCYSLGRRLKSVLQHEITPGPYNLNMPKVTKYGLVTIPGYRINSRTRYLSSFLGPGPLNYTPERYLNSVLPRAPIHSIHLPLPRNYFITPGPKYDPKFFYGRRRSPAYTLLGKRRSLTRMITPSPLHYGFPSQRYVKPAAPSFSLMPKRKERDRSPVPGPSAYNPNYKAVLGSAPRFKLNSHLNECIVPLILPEDDEYNVTDGC